MKRLLAWLKIICGPPPMLYWDNPDEYPAIREAELLWGEKEKL